MDPKPFSSDWFDQQFARTATNQAQLFHYLLSKLGSSIDRSKVSRTAQGKRAPQRDEIEHILNFFGMADSEFEAVLSRADPKITKHFLSRRARIEAERANSDMESVPELKSLEMQNKLPEIPERTIPLYSVVHLGHNAYLRLDVQVSNIICPHILATSIDAYAVPMPDMTMENRFSVGDILFVDPSTLPRERLYVVVRLYPDVEGSHPRAYVRQFLRWSADHLVVRQLSPEKEFHIASTKVMSMHAIRGSFFA